MSDDGFHIPSGRLVPDGGGGGSGSGEGCGGTLFLIFVFVLAIPALLKDPFWGPVLMVVGVLVGIMLVCMIWQAISAFIDWIADL